MLFELRISKNSWDFISELFNQRILSISGSLSLNFSYRELLKILGAST